jgi:hypothetical protein
MWAVVRIMSRFALGYQSCDLFRREMIACPHGGVAGHQAEQIAEELFAVRRPSPPATGSRPNSCQSMPRKPALATGVLQAQLIQGIDIEHLLESRF